MRNRLAILTITLIFLFASPAASFYSAFAAGDHPSGHAEKKQEMQHHHASPKEEFKLPPGTQEVKIDLSGPFCHKHPEEITEGLMQLEGVIHVEAFSGRRYILVHFDGEKTKPKEMATVLNGLKGSGWRCKGTLSSKRQTER